MATRDDIDRIVDIMTEYGDENGIPYNRENVEKHISDILSDSSAVILTSIHSMGELDIISGFFSLFITENPFLTQKLAIKTHWIIDKKYPSRGLNLLRAAERWAKLHGAVRLLVPMPNDGRNVIMKHAGFEVVTIDFKKELK
jgi:hypothetical protein